jgi:hypothetical protein
LIEGFSATEDLHADGVLLDLAGLSCKKLLAQIREQLREFGSALEAGGSEYRLEFGPLLVKLDRL